MMRSWVVISFFATALWTSYNTIPRHQYAREISNSQIIQSIRDLNSLQNSSCLDGATPHCQQLQLSSPQDFQVSQRNASKTGLITVSTQAIGAHSYFRLLVTSEDSRILSDKVYPATQLPNHVFKTQISLPQGGWYHLKVQEIDTQTRTVVGESLLLHVGVGEVFIVSGQSNAIASGEAPQTNAATTSGATLSNNQLVWKQKIDYEQRGSPWPQFASLLSARLKLPVAVLQIGCGNTEIAQWLPPQDRHAKPAPLCNPTASTKKGLLFTRLQRGVDLIGNYRALFWQQGEGDASLGTDPEDYYDYLKKIIEHITNHKMMQATSPWFVAKASYLPSFDVDNQCHRQAQTPFKLIRNSMLKIRQAQSQIIIDKVALPGPDADTLTGSEYRYPGPLGACIHLSENGLKTMGYLWFQKLVQARIINDLKDFHADEDSLKTTNLRKLSIEMYKYREQNCKAVSICIDQEFYITNKTFCPALPHDPRIGCLTAFPESSTAQAVLLYKTPTGFINSYEVDQNLRKGFILDSLLGFSTR